MFALVTTRIRLVVSGFVCDQDKTVEGIRDCCCFYQLKSVPCDCLVECLYLGDEGRR